MARPTKENAEYFSHDADMRHHRKVRAIATKYGITGYGVWCILLEMLTEANKNRLEVSDEIEWELRVPEFFVVSATEITEILSFCHRIKLLGKETEQETEFYYSKSLRERLSIVYEKRQRSREAYEKKAKSGVSVTETRISATETRVSATETTQSKVKESKVKERKVKERKVIPSKEGGESAPTPILINGKNKDALSALELLQKIATDTQYFAQVCSNKKTDAETIELLFAHFQSEQVAAGKQYQSLSDAKKHFLSWYDFTLAEHPKFIEKARNRANLAAKRAIPTQNTTPPNSLERAKELLNTLKLRIDMVCAISYPSAEMVLSEAKGIAENACELKNIADEIPTQKAKITQNAEAALVFAEQFRQNPEAYVMAKTAQKTSGNGIGTMGRGAAEISEILKTTPYAKA